jgi:nucleotide-binding universal stress UspA family protein
MTTTPILICYDGTDEARHAIDGAAKLLGPRRAVVLDVAPIVTLSESLAMTSSVVPGSAFTELNEAEATDGADEGAARARRAGFDAEPRARLSEPTWETIVDAAKDIDAAAIVMGTRALAAARELFEGSVSHDAIRHAGRPVLVIPLGKT